MVSLHERCEIGGYFLDDLPSLPNYSQNKQHILEEELRPSALKETSDYI